MNTRLERNGTETEREVAGGKIKLDQLASLLILDQGEMILADHHGSKDGLSSCCIRLSYRDVARCAMILATGMTC